MGTGLFDPMLNCGSWFYVFKLAVFYIREEVFGPVAPLLPFRTEEEAIALANDTNAGSSIDKLYFLLLFRRPIH